MIYYVSDHVQTVIEAQDAIPADDSVGEAVADISTVPNALAAYSDDYLRQSEVLKEIIRTSMASSAGEKAFNETAKSTVKLSVLRRLYEMRDRNAMNLLSTRHSIEIDDQYRVLVGSGEIKLKCEKTTIDYHLTVANCMGIAALLPNTVSNHQFQFELDLKKPFKGFKPKHAMLGFDPAGRLLYVGRCSNEDVYIAMAPNSFLRGEDRPCAAGHTTGSPAMSTRHYRQMVMMIAYFLDRLPGHGYSNRRSVYEQDLDSDKPRFDRVTNAL